MKKRMNTLAAASLVLALSLTAWIVAPAGEKTPASTKKTNAHKSSKKTGDRVIKSDEEWKKILTADQFYITRLKGTERPFSGEFNAFKGDGVYVCVCCGNELFDSNTKFKSGTGWPSFWEPVAPGKVGEVSDTRYGVIRKEIVCNRCDAHLGHVFEDGPQPTGLRYCVNSLALEFVTRNEEGEKKEEKKEE